MKVKIYRTLKTAEMKAIYNISRALKIAERKTIYKYV